MADIGTDILGLPPTVGGLTGAEWVPVVQGGTTKRTQTGLMGLGTITQVFPAGIDYVIDGNGLVLTTGIYGTGLNIPFNCTITEAVMNGNSAVGSAVVDIWKCTETQYDGGSTHPVVGDSITGGNPLTISVGSKATSTLTGWTIALTVGDVLWYRVNSNSVFTGLTIALKATRALP